jgi:hypothetical protein
MHKNFSFHIISVIFLILFSLSRAESGEAERNIFLTQMLSLAEKPKPYFLINMEENKIQLISKGIVLRDWTADKIVFSQGYLPLQTCMLEKKSIPLAQLRHAEPIEENETANTNTVNGTIDVKKTESKPYPSLDIEDMPSDYQLFLKGGASISVVSKAEDYKSAMKRKLINPILALWPFSKRDKSAKITVFFVDKTNSQTLFWAFTEETECIIIPSGYGDKKDFQF